MAKEKEYGTVHLEEGYLRRIDGKLHGNVIAVAQVELYRNGMGGPCFPTVVTWEGKTFHLRQGPDDERPGRLLGGAVAWLDSDPHGTKRIGHYGEVRSAPVCSRASVQKAG